MSDLTALLVAVALLLANAFFVGAEFALVSSRRDRLEPRADAGSKRAKVTLRALEQVSLVMAGAQLGITMASLGLGAVGEPAVAHLLEPLFEAAGVPSALLHPVALVVALTIVVYLHVVLGEMVPKNIALAGPERAALLLGPPMMAVVLVLKPVVVMLNAVANGVLRLLRVEPRDEVASAFTREEVASMVDESLGEGLIREDEYDRLAASLGFTERTVTDVLLTEDTVVTVPLGATGAEIEAVCAETGYSRFPVRGEAGMVGYLHVKDVLVTDPEGRQRPIERKWVRPFATVRPDAVLHDALTTLRVRGAHLARVVDGAGTVLGLVTLEDVLEELVGEIRDAAHPDD